MSKHFTVDRPGSEDDELHVVSGTQHRCAAADRAHKQGIIDSDCVLFPVGMFGRGMPLGIPFEVMTTEPCGACNTVLRAWFTWRGTKVIDFGAVTK